MGAQVRPMCIVTFDRGGQVELEANEFYVIERTDDGRCGPTWTIDGCEPGAVDGAGMLHRFQRLRTVPPCGALIMDEDWEEWLGEDVAQVCERSGGITLDRCEECFPS